MKRRTLGQVSSRLRLPVALLVGACSTGVVGCASDDTGVDQTAVEGAAASKVAGSKGAEARALMHLRADRMRAFADADHDFDVRDVIVDRDGTEHVRLDRRYKGLRVVGGDVVVHTGADGRFLGVSQTLSRGFDLELAYPVTEADAVATASARQLHPSSGEAPTAELVVWARGGHAVLAFEVVVKGQQIDQTPSELHVVVDATSRAVLESWEGIETAASNGTGKGYFSGTVALVTNSVAKGFELRDPSRGGQYTVDMLGKTAGNVTVMLDTDNVWGNSLLSDSATVAVDAQYGTAVTWDYFLKVHGRNGIANDGKGAYNRVHYGKKYNNAFWSDSCFCMTYGDGDGVTFNPFDSLDVAGHEMSHGVTSRTANLTYSGESGGLNEATSDIFGTLVEYYAQNAGDAGDYLIGEKLYKSGKGALRYMYNPSLDGASKSCWSSTLGTIDVHYSSGPANHFFYLLAEGSAPVGGLASPTCDGSTLTGIGKDKAGAIWFRALTTKFTSGTAYAGARAGTIAAADELYGAGSPESQAVAAAWGGVGVN